MTAPARPQAGRSRSFAYRPALDGVRALAVTGVLLYHGGVAWLRGGFLGVDAFFVLSGYLITSLLLTESDGTGRIRLGAFWLRRARRLLPALLVLLVAVVAAYRPILSSQEFGLLRGDALAALAYVANWRMIYRGDDYFAQTAAPSPLQHTWSLGIEEQFYLLWPLLVVALLALGAARARRAVLALSLTGAAGSAVVAALLADGATARAYFGTDARAQALLVGCALAALLHRTRAEPLPLARPGPAGRAGDAGPDSRALIGAAGAAGLLVAVWLWVHASGDAPWLYRGGLTLGALAVAAVIAHAVLSPHAPLARALAWTPLVWLGRISYGVYLWHWPLFGLLTADATGLHGPPLLGLRLVATLAVALVSYVVVEQPVRTGHLPGPVRALAGRVRPPGVALPRALTAGVGAAVAVTATAFFIATATVSAPAGTLDVPLALPTIPPTVHKPPMQRPERKPGTEPRIAFFGDSVAWTLAAYLPEQPGLRITNHAIQGCGIARLPDIIQVGEGHTNYPACPTWDQRWQSNVDYQDPDVSVILLDRWELMDRRLDGEYQHVGQPAFDAYLTRELEHAVFIAGSRGAQVVLLTAPYTHRNERPDGQLYDEDQPERVDAWNRLLRTVAAQTPEQVSVIDLRTRVCPDGKFTWNIGRLRVRSDGLHFTPEGVRQWIAPWLMPQLAAIARGSADAVAPGD